MANLIARKLVGHVEPAIGHWEEAPAISARTLTREGRAGYRLKFRSDTPPSPERMCHSCAALTAPTPFEEIRVFLAMRSSLLCEILWTLIWCQIQGNGIARKQADRSKGFDPKATTEIGF